MKLVLYYARGELLGNFHWLPMTSKVTGDSAYDLDSSGVVPEQVGTNRAFDP